MIYFVYKSYKMVQIFRQVYITIKIVETGLRPVSTYIVLIIIV